MDIQSNVSLEKLNTFGIDARSKYFVVIEDENQLSEAIDFAEKKALPILILSGGSNLLFTKDWEGLTLKVNWKGKEIAKTEDNYVWVKAKAGENWHEFVLWTLAQNFGGLENLSLIPGNVGTSPMQNIGAYGVEIKDTFFELKAFHIPSREIHTFTNEDCKFGYRESVFKNELKGKYIITEVTFRLTKNHHKLHTSYGAIENELKNSGIENPSIQDISNAVIGIRKSKLPDPKEIGNSGSFFKNPVVSKAKFEDLQKINPSIPGYAANENQVKLAAGWLIEQVGWKGKRIGDAGVHEKQALVLVNYGNASGQEIFDLSELIREDVYKEFGVEIQREVNIL